MTDKIITEFLVKISKDYKISKDDLLTKWTIHSNDQKKPVEDTDENEDTLKATTVPKLKDICRNKGLRVSGTKAELISRILGRESKSPSPTKVTAAKKSPKAATNTKAVEAKPKKPVTKTTVKAKKEKADKIEATSTVLNHIKSSKITRDAIRKNVHGNYTYPETRIVFNPSNKTTPKAIGRELDDGTVVELSKDDIVWCKKHNFLFELPQNLDINVKKDERESDSESSVEMEEEIEEDASLENDEESIYTDEEEEDE